uniref:Putative secreted protein n=1 Tax=Ixodes ricinus TaxID=34613 RepID=A0A6B0UE97_IXORI
MLRGDPLMFLIPLNIYVMQIMLFGCMSCIHLFHFEWTVTRRQDASIYKAEIQLFYVIVELLVCFETALHPRTVGCLCGSAPWAMCRIFTEIKKRLCVC